MDEVLLILERKGPDQRFPQRIRAGFVTEVLAARLMQGDVQQAQINARGASARTLSAAHAAPGQMEGARDLPGKVALRTGCRVDGDGPALVHDAPFAVTHRTHLAAGETLDAALELRRPERHPLARSHRHQGGQAIRLR